MGASVVTDGAGGASVGAMTGVGVVVAVVGDGVDSAVGSTS